MHIKLKTLKIKIKPSKDKNKLKFSMEIDKRWIVALLALLL